MALRDRASTSPGSEESLSSRQWPPFSNADGRPDAPLSSASSVRSLRKRHSFFFGRSPSDAGSRSFLSSASTTSSQISEETQYRPRSPIAASEYSRRRKLSQLSSIRDSILGSRKKDVSSMTRNRSGSNTSFSSSQTGQSSSNGSDRSREHFASEDDYYRFLEKKRISPPFNFQHVTHTAKQQLPRLETVDEKDLPGQFWSVSEYQSPKRHLNGIKAHDLPNRQQQLSISTSSPDVHPAPNSDSRPVSPLRPEELDNPPHIPTPVEPIGGLDETMFDEVTETRFNPDDGVRRLQPVKEVLKFPRRHSSLNALNVLSTEDESPSQLLDAFYESNSSDDTEVQSAATVSTQSDSVERSNSPESLIDTAKAMEDDVAYRSRQPLPPLPSETAAKEPVKTCPEITDSTRAPSISLQMPVQHPPSPKSTRSSKHSSQSSRSARKSPLHSSPSDARQSSSLSDATWEEDVDFCYEQEAESTCDFNWDAVKRQRDSAIRREDVSPTAESPYHAHSPSVTTDSGNSVYFPSSTETIAERRRSQKATTGHRRGTSVGHRGFLAARKSSNDLNALATQSPAPIQISPKAAPVSILSPVFSVNGAEDEPSKPPCALPFPASEGVNSEFLSDPESCRNSGSSKHRKSSSYGSHDSHNARLAPNSAVRETNRWSVASSGSLPELMHSRPRSKLFISKTIISKPLESLPQSPGFEKDGAEIEPESTIVPRDLQTQPVRNSFVLRRPETVGDRALLTAAGKAVQRRSARSAPPHRFSRILKPGEGVPEASATGPEWI